MNRFSIHFLFLLGLLNLWSCQPFSAPMPRRFPAWGASMTSQAGGAIQVDFEVEAYTELTVEAVGVEVYLTDWGKDRVPKLVSEQPVDHGDAFNQSVVLDSELIGGTSYRLRPYLKISQTGESGQTKAYAMVQEEATLRIERRSVSQRWSQLGDADYLINDFYSNQVLKLLPFQDDLLLIDYRGRADRFDVENQSWRSADLAPFTPAIGPSSPQEILAAVELIGGELYGIKRRSQSLNVEGILMKANLDDGQWRELGGTPIPLSLATWPCIQSLGYRGGMYIFPVRPCGSRESYFHYDASQNQWQSYPLTDLLPTPESIIMQVVFDGQYGYLIFDDGIIYRFDPQTRATTWLGRLPRDGFFYNFGSGSHFFLNGFLYMQFHYADRPLYRMDLDGGSSSRLNGPRNPLIEYLPAPYQVVAPDGRLYLASRIPSLKKQFLFSYQP